MLFPCPLGHGRPLAPVGTMLRKTKWLNVFGLGKKDGDNGKTVIRRKDPSFFKEEEIKCEGKEAEHGMRLES